MRIRFQAEVALHNHTKYPEFILSCFPHETERYIINSVCIAS